MGLDTTHDAWHGPYSSFNNFRRAVLKAYNGLDLFDYSGYESRCENKPSKLLKLDSIEDDGILILMDHSDCDGSITWVDCKLVADSLYKIAPHLEAGIFSMREKAVTFADGCMAAFNNKEDLEFR